ncbi:hypothetical protein [Streptomyces sp. NPDC088725]|uniref:hypothetical protein n=1 Tax=Streptomyces sp. NPDC088725 TaxID=3365873 RepID=UPI0037FA8F39
MSDDEQQYPYGEQGQSQGQGQYGDPAWREAQGSGQPHFPGQGQGQGHEEPRSAQTWEGQTWDTQYQPQVQPGQHAQQVQPGLHTQQTQQGQYVQQAAPSPYAPEQQYSQAPAPQAPQAPQAQASYQPRHAQPPRHAAPAPEAVPAAETAYLPRQTAYPLPPEAPGAGAQGPAQGSAEAYAAQAPAPAQAQPGGAPASAGFGAPTVMGNARVTDAQRARAEGRSPIIPPGIQPAGLTAVLGLLLAGGAALGPYALLVPLVLLQAVTAAGWFRLNGMWPARQGIALAFMGGLAADAALLVAGKENAPAAIMGTLGVWVLLTVVLQLRSRAGADERMQGLMATVASAALAILATGVLAAVSDAVVVGAIAVAAATVARALPLPGPVSVVVALLVAAGAGVLAGGFTDLGTQGALLGAGAGVCALVGLRAASYDYPSRFVHMTAGVALPLTAAAPAIYLLGRALV